MRSIKLPNAAELLRQEADGIFDSLLTIRANSTCCAGIEDSMVATCLLDIHLRLKALEEQNQ